MCVFLQSQKLLEILLHWPGAVPVTALTGYCHYTTVSAFDEDYYAVDKPRNGSLLAVMVD